MKKQKVWQLLLIVLTVFVVFFSLLFYGDNKYQAPPPYGKSGVLALNERTLKRKNPVFLIDGWLVSDGRITDKPTYIGEFSNLQRGDTSVSPHGHASYQITLRYDGAPQIVAMDFPQLYSWYSISLDETKLAQGGGNGWITCLLTPGDHVLTVETASKSGYYSGMYYPPMLGTIKTLLRLRGIKSFAYALAFLLPLALAVFTLFLWQSGGSISRWFGILCCCYAIYMFRYFVFLFSMPMAQHWFLAENLSFYCLCFCVVQLTVLASGAAANKGWQWMREILIVLPVILIMLCLAIPAVPWAVAIHSELTDGYYLVTFFCAVFFALLGIKAQTWESRYTLAGCLVFGCGLLANLLFSNLFEPIRFFWQFEWCGLFLVLLFGAMMVSRSRRLVRENEMLTNHLEEQVKKRTEEVNALLNERKAFFSDMAHDLKAPVFATQSFIEAIRRSGVGVDTELRSYLDQAEAKQREMARRLQGLSAMSELDKINGEQVRVSLGELFSEIYATYHGEAEVQAKYFYVEPLKQEVFFMAQPEKLNILFENLIYNALKATPREGSIEVSAHADGHKIRIIVEDTGCGIPKEELPLVFKRFYVGERNKGTGTGLGLYIVHGIVAEMGGTIEAYSEVGIGTKFMMEFPQSI